MAQIHTERGITLVEMLIALLLTGIISAAMFRVYINQHETWTTQDNITNMQQNARAAIDELTRQLRMSGYKLPNGLDAFDAYNTDPDTIVIYYNTTGCEAQIEHDMANTSADIRCDGHDVSCFSNGQIAYIYDPNLESGEFFTISNVQTGSFVIQHSTSPLSKAYPQGSQVMDIQFTKYYVDNSNDPAHPCLMVQVANGTPQVYAEDIEDIQFTYTLKNGTTVDTPTLKGDVRQIGISIRARTATTDVELGNIHRRRTYQSKVYLRNLGV